MPKNSIQYLVSLTDLRLKRVARPDDRDCISVECANAPEDLNLGVIIDAHPDAFIRGLRNLSSFDQELLLAYYVLRCPQTRLAEVIYDTQQYRLGQRVTAARLLLGFLAVGPVTAERIRPLLQSAGVEEIIPGCSMAEILESLGENGWDELYELSGGLQASTVRMYLSRTRIALEAAADSQAHALAAWIDSRVEWKATQKRNRGNKEAAVYIRLSPMLGQFRLRAEDQPMDHFFASRSIGEKKPGD